MADATAAQIDRMVVEAVKGQYARAKELLSNNMTKLHEIARRLYEKETITGEEFMQILGF